MGSSTLGAPAGLTNFLTNSDEVPGSTLQGMDNHIHWIVLAFRDSEGPFGPDVTISRTCFVCGAAMPESWLKEQLEMLEQFRPR